MKNIINYPEISVLLPVYNAEKYLSDCLDSLLRQTFYNFEIIAINDASTDQSLSILKKYAERDKRIKVFSNKSNLKIVATLNKGLELASAPLIARMDSDDVAFPLRLELQYEFMKKHPEVAICGTAVQILGTDEIWSVPEFNTEIRAVMLFNSPILHPTVIYRKTTILNHNKYEDNFLYAEDYDLWHRLSQDKTIIFSNINKPLLYYRMTYNEKSPIYEQTQQKSANSIREKQLKLLGISPTADQLSLHNKISTYKKFNKIKEIIIAYLWLRKLSKTKVYTKEINDTCWQRWRHICRSSSCSISYLLYLLLPSSNQRFKIIKKAIFNKIQKIITT